MIARLLATLFFMSWAMLFGFLVGRYYQVKTCAKSPGDVVVSSTADFCTYLNAPHLATHQRRAK